jgi:hypothetical protein
MNLIADIILVAHFLVICFVVGGQVLIFIGGWCGWPWVRNIWFRSGHLMVVTIVILQAWTGRLCALTHWENHFRELSGSAPHQGTFIQYWISRVIYYEAPLWVFALIYTLFGAIVILSLVIVRPKKK